MNPESSSPAAAPAVTPSATSTQAPAAPVVAGSPSAGAAPQAPQARPKFRKGGFKKSAPAPTTPSL